jgi:hypothetical protein
MGQLGHASYFKGQIPTRELAFDPLNHLFRFLLSASSLLISASLRLVSTSPR